MKRSHTKAIKRTIYSRRNLFERLEDRRVLADFTGLGDFLKQQLLTLQTNALTSNNALGGTLPVVGTTLQALAQNGTLLTTATTFADNVNDATTSRATLKTNLESQFGPGTVTDNNNDSFRIQFTNSSTVNVASFTSALNILPIDGANFSATLEYTIDVTVGVDGGGALFLNGGASASELKVSLTVADSALPALSLQLGGLTATATPQTDANAALDLDFVINITNPTLHANDPINITATTTGGADVDLGLTLTFPIGGLNPELTADFDMNWNLASASNNPVVEFQNVSLDLGSLVNGFGGESLRTLLDKAEPAFALAHKFDEPLPGLKELSDQIESLVGDLEDVETGIPQLNAIFDALSNPTLLNFMESAATLLAGTPNGDKIQSAVDAIKAINKIGELVNGFAGQSSLAINFGTFTLGTTTDLEAASGPFAGLTPALTAPATPIGSQSGVSGLQTFLNDNYLSTDLLDPLKVFQLLAGSDSVKIIEYAQPFAATSGTTFNLVNQNFAIGVVPANFKIDIVLDPISFNVKFGFDSRGLTSGDVTQGLYVGAKSAGGPVDQNLLNVGAHLNVDLAVGQDYEIASVRLGVRGSIDAAAGVYFVEQPAGAGKLHVSDFGAGCTPLAGELNVTANVSLFYDARLEIDLQAIFNSVKALVEQAIKNNPALLAVDKMIDVAGPLLIQAGIDPAIVDQLSELADNPETALKAVVDGFQAVGGEASEEFKKVADKIAAGGAAAEQYISDRLPETPEDVGNAILTGGGAWLAGGISATDSTTIFSRPILTWEIGQCGSQDFGGGQSATPFVTSAVPAILGEVVDGVLTIFVGPAAHLRNVEADKIDEPVTIRPVDPNNASNGEVVVSMFGASQTFTGVISIEANAGDGNNVLDGSLTGLPMYFVGGSGPDTLTGGLKSVTFFGGSGANTLTGSPEIDFLYGGQDRDIIIGLAGADVLYGFEGQDILIGDHLAGSSNDDPTDPTLFGDDKIFAGEGNDYVYAGGGADEIDGGLGSDTLLGGAGPDTIYGVIGHEYIVGGDGNDVIFTGEGSSYIDGSEGNDFITAGHGANFLIGGEGDDTIIGNSVADVFFYSEGDGSDVLEGNGGENFLLLDLYSGGDYRLSPNGTRLEVVGQGTIGGTPRSFVLSTANMNQVFAYVPGAGSEVRINNLADTSVAYLAVSLKDTHTTAVDLFVHGGNSADDIFVSPADTLLEVSGAGPHIVFSNIKPIDLLTIFGNGGNDQIAVASGAEALATITVDGGAGDDSLSGPAILRGGAGDDVLRGVMGFANTFDGGANTDTLIIGGTAVADSISVSQTSATGLTAQIGAVTDNETIAALELVVIEGGNGADLIGVSVADNLASSLAFHVSGGNAGDRLIVRDEGLGDLVLHRLGADENSGSVTVGLLAAIEYDGVERVDITPLNTITGRTGNDNLGRLLVIPFDRYESNNDRTNAIPLGGTATFIAGLSIDPGPQVLGGAFGTTAGDNDWFEFRAEKTGTFRFAALFQEISQLANTRAGLPAEGDLNLAVYSSAGTLIASSTGSVDNEAVDISVAGGNVYYVRVYGQGDAVNVYDLKISEVDLSGPRVIGVAITSHLAYDLFAPSPALVGPTPGIKSLTISLQDNPSRAPGDLYAALAAIASNKGHYTLTGDHTGVVAIQSVVVSNVAPAVGTTPTATITLTFADFLPDDRFTLTVADSLTDPAGNRLDGESNLSMPTVVSFNSGDGVAGGSFSARFTVDSRAEFAVFSQGGVVADLNSNFRFDALGTALDAANRDVLFQIGTISDQVFAGKFEPGALSSNDNDGFDKLGAYGYDNVAREYRFLLDLNHDGMFDARVRSQYQINAIPVAGNFDPTRPGDEIGLFDGTKWYLDTNGDNQLDRVITGALKGLPIVGDFDGDGADDLGAYDSATNLFQFDLFKLGGWNGAIEDSFTIDQLNPAGSDNGNGVDNGFNERPFAGDWNLDGIDDLGLAVPARAGSPADGQGEWFVLVSDRPGALPRQIFNGYTPSPLGNDLYATFGAAGTLPLFGNFDPPLSESTSPASVFDVTPYLASNAANPYDTNGDGVITPLDALLIINALNAGSQSTVPVAGQAKVYLDVSADQAVSPLDALLVINWLNSMGASRGEIPAAAIAPAEAEPISPTVDPRFFDYIFSQEDDDEEEDVADLAV